MYFGCIARDGEETVSSCGCTSVDRAESVDLHAYMSADMTFARNYPLPMSQLVIVRPYRHTMTNYYPLGLQMVATDLKTLLVQHTKSQYRG